LHLQSVGQAQNDFFENDPTVDVTLTTEQRFPIQLNIACAKDYSVFEMQVVTLKGVINMEDGGERWRYRRAEPSSQLEGYHFLNHGEWNDSQGALMLSRAVTNIFLALDCGEPLLSSGSSALYAQELCEEIKTAICHQVVRRI